MWAMRRPVGRRPCAGPSCRGRSVGAFNSSIVMTPSAKPAIVTNDSRRCITSGRIFVASAAKTMPAANSCTALQVVGPGVRTDTAIAPTTTAAAVRADGRERSKKRGHGDC